MNSGGKESLSLDERSKNVNDLLLVLMDINEINGGNSDTAEKMKVHAKNFEAALYAKSSSKKEYMDSMREKVNAMRNTRDIRKKAAVSATNPAMSSGYGGRPSQPPSQQQRQGSMMANGNYVPNTLNMNSQTFLNQQAQVRQQAAQQMRSQQHQQQQRPQLTPQQQQLINQMKVAIIPRELLQRIPNIPPGVNTWQQITELAQQKRLTAQDMQMAKEIYKLHQQLLYKSKLQQQQNANNRINMQQQTPQPQLPPQPSIPNQRMSSNGNMSQPQQQQQQQQPQQRQLKPGEIPNVLGQINQIFTPEEQRSLLQEAMEACKNFQMTQFGKNMTDSNRQNFIRKYINQKALKKIQNMRLAQMATQGGQQPQQRQQTQPQSQQQTQPHSRNPSAGMMANNGQMNGTNALQSNMSQSIPPQQLNRAQQQPQSQQGQMQQPRPNVLQAFAPTPQDVETVKRISAEAARTPLRLSDLTKTLTPQEKEEIKRKLQLNQQLFAQVSNYAPQVYVLTKSENFLKEVLQLRIFAKEILEKCTKGIFVVRLDTVDKLVLKYQKYWESMKIQLLRRQQLIQQQHQQQQQQQQQHSNGHDQTGPNISQQQQRVQGSLQQIQQQMQQKQRQQQRTMSNGANGTTMNASNPAALAAASAVSNGNNYVTPNFQQTVPDGSSGSAPTSDYFNPLSSNVALGYVPADGMKPTSSQGVSPKRDFNRPATGNHNRNKSNAKKLSPINASQASINSPSVVPQGVLHSRSATPAVMGMAGSPLSNTKNNGTFQKTPSPLTVPSVSQPAAVAESRPYKEEEDNLRNLNIRKAEIISRFKHRQEMFSKSAVDMFLSTLAECIGVKDDQVDLVMNISQSLVDQVNGTGKKKLTKAAQRARDQDVVSLSMKSNKLIMESKASPTTRSYRLRPSALASVFKNVSGMTDANEMNLNHSTPGGGMADFPAKSKRRLEDIEISPTNSNTSPSSLMSESKKLKIDSPEDMFIGKDEGKHQTALDARLSNVWSWNYWASLD